MTLENVSEFCSAFAAVVALIISCWNIIESKKNIEASTRPIIKAYLARTSVRSENYYLVIKNYGASNARITDLTLSVDWDEISSSPSCNLTQLAPTTEFPPGYKLCTALNTMKLKKLVNKRTQSGIPFGIILKIKYVSETNKHYAEECILNLSLIENLQLAPRPSFEISEEGSLRLIANGLIDIEEKLL